MRKTGDGGEIEIPGNDQSTAPLEGRLFVLLARDIGRVCDIFGDLIEHLDREDAQRGLGAQYIGAGPTLPSRRFL